MHFSSFKNSNKKHIHIIVGRITESFVYFKIAIPVGSFYSKYFEVMKANPGRRQENNTSRMHHLDSYIYKHSSMGKCIAIIKYL